MKKYLFTLLALLTLVLTATQSFAFTNTEKWTLSDDSYFYVKGINQNYTFDTSTLTKDINLQYQIKDTSGAVIQAWTALNVKKNDVLQTKIVTGNSHVTTTLLHNDKVIASTSSGLSGGRTLDLRYSETAAPLPVNPTPVDPTPVNPSPNTPSTITEFFETYSVQILMVIVGLIGLVVLVKILKKL